MHANTRQIDSIVQADSKDKKSRPLQWKTWRYEVVLAVNDPTVKGDERPKDMPLPPIFPQGTSRHVDVRCIHECEAFAWRSYAFGALTYPSVIIVAVI